MYRGVSIEELLPNLPRTEGLFRTDGRFANRARTGTGNTHSPEEGTFLLLEHDRRFVSHNFDPPPVRVACGLT